jgi:hypothetical protein
MTAPRYAVKTSPQIQAIITALVRRHGADFDAGDLRLRLEHSVFEPLVIECTGLQLVSVAHYYEQNGDLIPDPDVTFYTGKPEWIAVAISDYFGHRTVATVEGDTITFNPPGQADLAAFCRTWARNLRQQGWLTAAHKMA